MDLYEACEKITAKILSGEACEHHLEQFIINMGDGETPAMSLAMVMSDKGFDCISSQKIADPDEWAEEDPF